MRVPYSWLKEFVALSASPHQVARRLTMIGLEVTAIEEVGDDLVLDVQPTSNRGDCLSVLGVAREVAAAFDLPLAAPRLSLEEHDEAAAALVSVRIEDPDLCPRYSARVVSAVEVKTSPPWVIHRLLRCGMRPINNVVDATNLVLLETGQPLHAFDYDLVGRDEAGRAAIIVRRAREGERLITLDGVERRLKQGMLVIADPQRPIALAGIMGGANTEVSYSTTRVLLESAHFDRISIRRTRKALELETEASYRFERIVDPGGTVAALDRVAALIAQASGGKVARGVVDSYPKPVHPVTIELRPKRCNRLLGTRLSPGRMAAILRRLHLEVRDGDPLRVTCPTFRPDLQAEIDLVEEIARIHGYDRIPATVTPGAAAPGRRAPELEFDERVRQVLLACGLNEAMSYTLTDAGVFDRLHLPVGHPLRRALRVKNPKSEEYTTLRTTMLDSMLSALAHNCRRGVNDVYLFEIGRVYLPRAEGELPEERRMAGIAIMGSRLSSRWNLEAAQTRADFFTLKGIVQQLLGALCADAPEFAPVSHPALHPGQAARIMVGGEEVGVMGAPSAPVREHYDLAPGAYVAEINLAALMRHGRGAVQVQRPSRYPAVRRDIALIVPGGVTARQVEQVIARAAGAPLERLDLFDVYTGPQVPRGYRSLAYSLLLRDPERTLTDQEADGVLAKIKQVLREDLQAQIRE